MIKKNLPQLILVIVSIAGAYFVSCLANLNKLDNWIIVIIITSLSIIVWLINTFIFENINKRFENKVKGFWIQQHNSGDETDDTYCLMEIKSGENNNLVLEGTVYSFKGKKIAEFKSKYVGINPNDNRIVYIYDGYYVVGKLSGNGYGQVYFSNSDSGVYISGNGYFQDEKSDNKPINYDIDRLNHKLCNKLINKEYPEQTKDKIDFIKRYHEYMIQ